MASEAQNMTGSQTPPAWQRHSYPPPASTTATPSAQIPTSPRTESAQVDVPTQPVPAPKYLDLAPVKPEKDLFDTKSQSSMTPATSGVSVSNSTSMYHLGPPPPYSSCYPSQPTLAPTMAVPNAPTAYVSPPVSRRESCEDKTQEPTKLLPSISEALKLPPFSERHSQNNLGSTIPHPPAFSQVSLLAEAAQSVSSASPALSRSNPDSHHPSSLSSFSSQHSPHNSKPPDVFGQRSYAHSLTDSPRQSVHQSYVSAAASPVDAQAPMSTHSLPPQPYSSTALPPPPPPQASASYSGPQYSPGSGSMAQQQAAQPPEHIHQHHGQERLYHSQPPLHSLSSGFSFPPPQTSGLSHQQQMNLGIQKQWHANVEMEKVEEQRRAAAAAHAKRGSLGGISYGLTVKRHLDDFELENSLNEIAERTYQVMEFSRAYGSEAHKYGRSALPISQLPTADKVSEMINQNMAVTDALHRLKNTIEGMQIAAAEEQARQQQQSVLAKPGLHSAYGSDVGSHQGYDMHGNHEKGDLNGGGFAGSDPKKPRRGRNAPPGRCHSCNRAETPEWRRGPDGARTLCNACGLHYAKLTRKMGVKPGQSGGSQLRPKDGEDTAA